MPANDDPKLELYGGTTPIEPAAAKAEPPRAPAPGPQKLRGAYRVSDEDMRKDPQVQAFLMALRRIVDPQKRQGLEWLVYELARTKRRGR